MAFIDTDLIKRALRGLGWWGRHGECSFGFDRNQIDRKSDAEVPIVKMGEDSDSFEAGVKKKKSGMLFISALRLCELFVLLSPSHALSNASNAKTMHFQCGG